MTTFPHSWWWLTVDALCVARLARLIAYDTIMRPVLRWLSGAQASGPLKRPRLLQWLGCPWCLSPWLAAGVVAATTYIPGIWQYAAAVLAFSEVAGFLSEHE